MKKRANTVLWGLLLMASAMLITGCHTGIEGTRAIKMSRSDLRETRPSEEEIFARALRSDSMAVWSPGKKFLISDSKAVLVLELPSGVPADPARASLAGDTLRFERVVSISTPGSGEVAAIEFRGDKGIYRYRTTKTMEEALKAVSGLDIPMLIDLDMVAAADTLLRGRRLWTRSGLWYDAEGNPFDGRKFVPVTVSAVRPGNMVFPLAVDIVDSDGREAYMYMNVRAGSGLGAESRTFPSLFSLTDPQSLYQDITPEIWRLIQDGRVTAGMTKLECKLSLGNPDEVNAGHDWSNTIDVWSYRDGTFLRFENGLLVDFRY